MGVLDRPCERPASRLDVDVPRLGDATQGLLAVTGVRRASAVRLRGRGEHHVLGSLPRGTRDGTVPRRLRPA